jgi:hypothetical protein
MKETKMDICSHRDTFALCPEGVVTGDFGDLRAGHLYLQNESLSKVSHRTSSVFCPLQ